MMMYAWSAQQEAIFTWFKTNELTPRSNGGAQHLIVRARVGTGKSTTIREGVKQAPERFILIGAFSKDIQLAMEAAKSSSYDAMILSCWIVVSVNMSVSIVLGIIANV